MNPPDRKRIVLRLTPAELSDPKQLLAETRKALREQADLTLAVYGLPEDQEPVGEEVRKAREHLEAKVLEVATAALDKHKLQIEADAAALGTKAKGEGLGGRKWLQAVKKVGGYLRDLIKEGVKVTVGELVKNSVKGDGPSHFPFT